MEVIWEDVRGMFPEGDYPKMFCKIRPKHLNFDCCTRNMVDKIPCKTQFELMLFFFVVFPSWNMRKCCNAFSKNDNS